MDSYHDYRTDSNIQVNCYDLIEDKDSVTEGVLRARFSKAAESSPCILILRYLDALSQTTEVKEHGKRLSQPNQTQLELIACVDPPLTNAIRECISELQESWKETSYPVIVCGTCTEVDHVHISLRSIFKHEINFHVGCYFNSV